MTESTNVRADAPGRNVARISPELALVDPDLAVRVRKWLRANCLSRRPPLPVLRHTTGLVSDGNSEADRFTR